MDPNNETQGKYKEGDESRAPDGIKNDTIVTQKHSSSYENEITHSCVLWVLSRVTVFLGLEISLLWGGGVLVLSICFLLKAFFLLKDSEGYSIAQWIDMVWIQRQP